MTFVISTDLPPHIVWNASESVARGFYWIAPCPCTVGALVLVHPPGWAARLASVRGYLPPDTPILKRIAAASGDEICRSEGIVSVNGRRAVTAKSADQRGRLMPTWHGCLALGADETFLLNDHPASFDGRYLGATKCSQIIGRAVPILTYARRGTNSPK